ncbi:MAG: hypothetical protein LBK99_12080, partial [Opitutaceae bacterium]|nr:hypothetical protein [Opitutaceae bacterium]
LTVIAIIGILAGITIPVVSGVRKKARSVECIHNLREIFVAITLYTQDHKDAYPRSHQTLSSSDGAGLAGQKPYWFGGGTGMEGALAFTIWPYLDTGRRFRQGWVSDASKPHPQKTPFVCPAVESGQHGWGDSGVDSGINSNILSEGGNLVRVSDIVAPSTTLLVADCKPSSGTQVGRVADVVTRHSNSANVLFFDGHIKAVTATQLANTDFATTLVGKHP